MIDIHKALAPFGVSSVYDLDEHSLNELIYHALNNDEALYNYVVAELAKKTDLYGDHLGTWQGLNKPTLSEEGAHAQVEKNMEDIININNSIENINNNLDPLMDHVEDIQISLNDSIDKINILDNEINILNKSIKFSKTLKKLFNNESVKGVAFGDSLTTGSYALGSGEVTTLWTFPKRLEFLFKVLFDPNQKTSIINEGVAGFNSEQITEKILSYDLTNVDFITLLMGTNDILQDSDMLDYENNLNKIIRYCKETDTEIILLNIPPIFNKDTAHKVRPLNNIINNYSDDLTVINLYDEILKIQNFKIDPLELLPDGVHFADDKYLLIADIIVNQILNSFLIHSNEVVTVADKRVITNGNVNLGFPSELGIPLNSSAFVTKGAKLEWLRVLYYADKPSKLKWVYIKSEAGGVGTISNNDKPQGYIDCSGTDNIYNEYIEINCEFGINLIDVRSDSIDTNGKVVFLNYIETV